MPQVQFNFIPLAQLQNVAKDETCGMFILPIIFFSLSFK